MRKERWRSRHRVGAAPSACYVEVVDDDDERSLRAHEDDAEALPIVARMVVEIRSDGTRTIARGALDDRVSGQQVAVELTPSSPWAMAKGLAKLLITAPWSARSAVRRVLRPRAAGRGRLREGDDV